MQCEHFLESLDDYVDDRLDDERRQEFRRHLATCRECRELAVASDPTLLFAAAPAPPRDDAQIEACVAGVEALMRQDRLARRLRPRRRPWLAAAAAVLLLVGGPLVWKVAAPDRPSQERVETGVSVARDDGGAQEPPQVDVNMGDDAVRVYQFAQEEDENTAVYFIVNASLES